MTKFYLIFCIITVLVASGISWAPLFSGKTSSGGSRGYWSSGGGGYAGGHK